MALKKQKEKFAQSIAQGMSGSSALRSAYKTDKMKPQTIANNAYKLMQDGDILARIEELRRPIIEKVGLTLEAHLSRLDHLSKRAEEESNYGPAVSAEVARGKAAGLYIDRHEHTGNVTIVASEFDELL